jgi:hypothetical protein
MRSTGMVTRVVIQFGSDVAGAEGGDGDLLSGAGQRTSLMRGDDGEVGASMSQEADSKSIPFVLFPDSACLTFKGFMKIHFVAQRSCS